MQKFKLAVAHALRNYMRHGSRYPNVEPKEIMSSYVRKELDRYMRLTPSSNN